MQCTCSFYFKNICLYIQVFVFDNLNVFVFQIELNELDPNVCLLMHFYIYRYITFGFYIYNFLIKKLLKMKNVCVFFKCKLYTVYRK